MLRTLKYLFALSLFLVYSVGVGLAYVLMISSLRSVIFAP
jgi:hypothetical protein